MNSELFLVLWMNRFQLFLVCPLFFSSSESIRANFSESRKKSQSPWMLKETMFVISLIKSAFAFTLWIITIYSDIATRSTCQQVAMLLHHQVSQNGNLLWVTLTMKSQLAQERCEVGHQKLPLTLFVMCFHTIRHNQIFHTESFKAKANQGLLLWLCWCQWAGKRNLSAPTQDWEIKATTRAQQRREINIVLYNSASLLCGEGRMPNLTAAELCQWASKPQRWPATAAAAAAEKKKSNWFQLTQASAGYRLRWALWQPFLSPKGKRHLEFGRVGRPGVLKLLPKKSFFFLPLWLFWIHGFLLLGLDCKW